MPSPARGTLAWRLYLLGFIQLVLLACAVAGVGQLIRPTRPEGVVSFEPPPGAAPELGPPPGPPPGEPGGPPPGPPPGRPPRHHPDRGPVPLGPLLTFFVSGLVIVGVGSLLTARWIVRPLESLSRAARALGSGDLSARSGLVRRDEVGEVGRAFDEMAARVETLMLAERELLANVSHELRTPLARIRVALDIAGESGQAPGPMAEIAADLSEIEKLVDDILTAARLDVAERRAGPGGFELRRERATVEALVAHAAELFRGRHPERRLDVAVDAGLPDVDLDRMLLRRALDNLLDNAHKYSPDASKPVALRAVAAGEGVAVEVVDRGVGISPEDQKHLFTPFFRAERSRSRGTGGVGLGLLLARRIVDAHGGNLEITSAPGDGTTARITLPPAPRS